MSAVFFATGLKLGSLISDKGLFSDVYEGIELVKGQVAIKVPKRFGFESEPIFQARQARLLHEGRYLQKASHSNVVSVHSVLRSSDGKHVVLVTEYCPGGSVEQLAELGPIQLKKCRDILRQTALGLQCVHNEGLLHRDIKPGNILLDAKGRAKLADFGCVTDDIVQGFATGSGYTAHWSPEVHVTKQTSELSDVWAFGVTAYRMINGNAVWNWLGGNANVKALVINGKFSSHLKWMPHVPREWKAFVCRALQDDPSKRFQSAADLLSALERLPVEPDWNCDFSMSLIRWTREKDGRIHKVIWDRTNPTAQTWEAVTLPTPGKSGKQHRLSGAGGVVSFTEAQRGLEEFFERLVVR